MNDKPAHNKYIKEPLPTPDVSADDAWQQMHQLLVQHHLTAKPNKDKRRRLLWFCLLLLISISGVIAYFFFNNNPGLLYEHKTVADKQNTDTGNSNKTLLNEIQKSKQASFGNAFANSGSNNKKLKDFPLHTRNNNFINIDKPVNLALIVDSNVIITSINNQQADTISSFTFQDLNFVKRDKEITLLPATTDSIGNNTKNEVLVNRKNKKNEKQNKIKPELGLPWNIDFSLTNNSHYFSSYNNKGDQYYMWLLPSLKAGININDKQSISIIVNPYKQQFAGNKIMHIQKPWIASVEPDVVTRLIKSRGINLGLQYNRSIIKKLSVNIGGSYTFQQNALTLEQSVENFSGNIISERIYGTDKKDKAFQYLKPSYLSGDASLQYNFKKFDVGAGVTVPLNNLAADKQYLVRPVNGELFLRYRFK